MASESGPGPDLAQLEYEFATNPNSEAFIPLAEAYLQMGRFVEAMVVCKKGIKSHPELPTGRLIMARIYSDQAKHQKAIDELNNLLELSPQNVEAFKLLGKINLKLGKNDEGIAYLKKTLDASPEDNEARDELLKRGIDYQPPKPEPEPVAEPQVQAPMDERPTQQDMSPVQPGVRGSKPVSERPTQPSVPKVAKPKPRPQNGRRIIEQYADLANPAKKKPKHTGIKVTLSLAGVLAVVLIIYIIYTWQAGLKQAEINKNLEEGRARFNRDTYAGYMAALQNYRNIHKLDKEHPEALARGAFIGAVLTGEFGAERKYLDEGDKYMRESMALKQTSTMHTAAQAFLLLYGGGGANEAVKLLTEALKTNSGSPILHTAMGLVLLKKGDLTQAKEHLLKGAAQSETRALVGLGEYAIRRSLYREATQAFSRALQADNEHTRSVLGIALVSLLRGREGVYEQLAAKKLKDFSDKLQGEACDKEKQEAKFLGLVLKARDRKQRKTALAEIDTMLKKNSANTLFHFLAAREYRHYGKLKRAKQLIERALRMDSTRPDFVLEEAAIYLAMKDYEAARARALRVQRMDAEGGQSMLLVGDAYMGEKNWAKAQEYYEKARKFDDAEAISHLKLARLFLNKPSPDKDQAQAELEIAVNSLGPIGERRMAAVSATMLAKIYASKNRMNEFASAIQKALNFDQSYPPPHALIATYATNADVKTKDTKQAAKEHCTKYLKLDPRGHYAESCRKILSQLR